MTEDRACRRRWAWFSRSMLALGFRGRHASSPCRCLPAVGVVFAAGRKGHEAAAGLQALVRAHLLDVAAGAPGYRRRRRSSCYERHHAGEPERAGPLSLNELLFHRPKGSPGHALFESLSIPAVLGWMLTIIGVHVWSQRSWAFSTIFALLPPSSSTASGRSSLPVAGHDDKNNGSRWASSWR